MAALTEDERLAALAEAKAALHNLRIGKAVVSVGYGDRRIQYDLTTVGNLQSYIAELEGAAVAPVVTRRRPFGVIW